MAKLQRLSFVFFEWVNPPIFELICLIYKKLNLWRGRSRVLVFTDSRGFEVVRPWNRRNPLSSYVFRLMRTYATDVYICPEKHTSLLDFLDLYDRSTKDYRFIVLHCGVVDFSPRPKSSYEEMRKAKIHIAKKYNIQRFFEQGIQADGEEYEGEVTYSFFTRELVRDVIVPMLSDIDGLVYIGITQVDLSWRGIYWRDRPSNINSAVEMDDLLVKQLKSVVDLNGKGLPWVRLHTADNVHLNKIGFKYIDVKLRELGV